MCVQMHVYAQNSTVIACHSSWAIMCVACLLGVAVWPVSLGCSPHISAFPIPRTARAQYHAKDVTWDLGLNSGPLVCVESISLMEVSPQPLSLSHYFLNSLSDMVL